MSFHPPHLDDSLGQLLPKALIPLCSYQGTMLGKNVSSHNFTACRGFQPSLKNGQLCYSLNLSQVIGSESKSGIKNGLTIVIDQPTSFELTRAENSVATIHLETLAGFSDNRPGRYYMSTLKMIAGTDAYMAMSKEEKGCQSESFEECSMRQVFAELQKECRCVPWSLRYFQKVSINDTVLLMNILTFEETKNSFFTGCTFLQSSRRILRGKGYASKPWMSCQMHWTLC